MKILNIQNILVPIDFSTMSIQAVTTARPLARRYGARIHRAHVRHSDYIATFSPPAPPFAPFPLMSYEPELDKSVIKKLNALAREHGISSATFWSAGQCLTKSVGLPRKFLLISS